MTLKEIAIMFECVPTLLARLWKAKSPWVFGLEGGALICAPQRVFFADGL